MPITLGVGEPFTVTLTVAAYFALLFSLPVLLYQAYAFVLPAFSPRERRVALPMMLMVPLLFLAGVAFGYWLVLPPAISFLQNFNTTNFDVLIQAKDYYRFELLALLSTGLVFQLPVGLLALNAVGIVSAAAAARELALRDRRDRRRGGDAARRRPRHDGDPDGTAAPALPPEYPAADDRRSAAGGPRRDAAFAPHDGDETEEAEPCCSTCRAAAAEPSSRSSTWAWRS